jgi:hypothetical protein
MEQSGQRGEKEEQIDKQTNYLCGAEHYSTAYKVCRHSIVSQHFMEAEGSWPSSQELFTSTYPERDQSSPHHPILSLQDPSYVIQQPTSLSS